MTVKLKVCVSPLFSCIQFLFRLSSTQIQDCPTENPITEFNSVEIRNFIQIILFLNSLFHFRFNTVLFLEVFCSLFQALYDSQLAQRNSRFNLQTGSRTRETGNGCHVRKPLSEYSKRHFK